MIWLCHVDVDQALHPSFRSEPGRLVVVLNANCFVPFHVPACMRLDSENSTDIDGSLCCSSGHQYGGHMMLMMSKTGALGLFGAHVNTMPLGTGRRCSLFSSYVSAGPVFHFLVSRLQEESKAHHGSSRFRVNIGLPELSTHLEDGFVLGRLLAPRVNCMSRLRFHIKCFVQGAEPWNCACAVGSEHHSNGRGA